MNREHFYALMSGEGTLDYELYLNTKTLLSCQTKFEELCNKDELQFQLVHQIEELWMKLIAYTLLDIDEYLQQENTNRVITLFRRVHIANHRRVVHRHVRHFRQYDHVSLLPYGYPAKQRTCINNRRLSGSFRR